MVTTLVIQTAQDMPNKRKLKQKFKRKHIQQYILPSGGTKGGEQFLNVYRGCNRLQHEDDRTVNPDACYNFKNPADARRLNNNDTYSIADRMDIYQILTCNTDKCNTAYGFTFNLCDQSGVGFLKSFSTSHAKKFEASSLFIFLFLAAGFVCSTQV